ncbi:MAG: aldehyde dehydrogenase family protein [Gemmatimonadetes bacterium]|nr:aldehyde dehydrogenase family protein [Gemmatimonadota bacterium]
MPVATTARFETRLFIANEFVDAADGSTFPTVNPATGELLAQVAEAKAADVDRAVAAARAAFEGGDWRTMSARDRGRLLYRLADLIEREIDEIARIETLDNGKPIFESRQIDLPEAISILRYYAGWADKWQGEVIPVAGPFLNYTLREPTGVVAAIVPWNFPIVIAMWKIAPALACGNTVILKPAEETPLSTLRLAALAREAGFPPGVWNVVPGYGEVTGAALVRHPGVDKIAFTGSTETGRIIMREAAATLKNVQLELGGKSPNIIFADADPEAAVRGAAVGIFYGKGEVCSAGSRLLVQRSIHDVFLEKLVERAKKTVPGDPLDPKTRLGALVSERQMQRVLGYVDTGKREGATLLCGGARVGERGYYVSATVFDRVQPDMTIAQEEIFGPVLATLTFEDEEEAIAIANRTMYGLAAGIWTRDVKKAHRVARAIQAGTVWINTFNRYDPASPFGGTKQSGFGRDLGMHALNEYTQVKSVWVDLS